MINKEEVEHIAKLARLELTEKEVEKMQKDLSAILDYFDLLKRAPKAEISKSPASVKNSSLREDKIISSHDMADELIAGFPSKKDDYIKVKEIFK
jgi:aspartyl/glutamyl-tRNA(Asn/Gln) amidotransferase C subunit